MLIIFIVERWFWEFKMLFGYLVVLHCLIAFISVFFPSWKIVLKQPRHLSAVGLSIELFSWFLSQSRHLSIARWIDWESFYPLDRSSTDPRSIELLFTLDTCSIDASIEPFKRSSTPLNLSRFIDGL